MMAEEDRSRSGRPAKGSLDVDRLYQEWRDHYGPRGKDSAEAHLVMAASLLGCKMRDVVEQVNELIERNGTLEQKHAAAVAHNRQLSQRLSRLEKLFELLSHNVESLPDSVVDSMIWRGARIGASQPEEDEDSILP